MNSDPASHFGLRKGLLALAFVAVLSVHAAAADETATESAIYSFSTAGADARNPQCLIQGTDGKLYGIGLGGVFGSWALFRYDLSAGAETVIYSAPASTGGIYIVPTKIIQAGDGNFYGISDYGGANGFGSLFEYDVASGTGSVIHSFQASATDGTRPSDITVGRDGNVYGVTSYGGSTTPLDTTGQGALFEYDVTARQEVVLYSFGSSGNVDARYPLRLILGSDGNLYGAASGGPYNNGYAGTLFKFDVAAHQESVLVDFGSSSVDGRNPTQLIQASDGNFYGVTMAGGADYVAGSNAGSGTFFKYDVRTGVETPVAGATGYLFSSLVQGADGNLYGVTQGGGADNAGSFSEYNVTTQAFTLLYSFLSAGASGYYPYSVILATDDNFYGPAINGGANGGGTLFKIKVATTSSTGGGSSGTSSSGSGGGGTGWPELLVLGSAALLRWRQHWFGLALAPF